MAKQTQNLVDLVQPQRGLALFQIADKPQPHTSPIRKIMLGQPCHLPLGFHKLDQWIIHLNTRTSIFLTQIPFTIPERVLQFLFSK